MEFNEKIQKLRVSHNLTQEELAEKLFVSRTAVSKWESGKGYPNIDTLKLVSKFFDVSIDYLICGNETAIYLENNIKNGKNKLTYLILSILDCLTLLLFFIPVFRNGNEIKFNSVPVYKLSECGVWLKILFILVICLNFLIGFSGLIINNFDLKFTLSILVKIGIVVNFIGTALFVFSRQAYAGLFYLIMFAIKIFIIFIIKKQ